MPPLRPHHPIREIISGNRLRILTRQPRSIHPTRPKLDTPTPQQQIKVRHIRLVLHQLRHLDDYRLPARHHRPRPLPTHRPQAPSRRPRDHPDSLKRPILLSLRQHHRHHHAVPQHLHRGSLAKATQLHIRGRNHKPRPRRIPPPDRDPWILRRHLARILRPIGRREQILRRQEPLHIRHMRSHPVCHLLVRSPTKIPDKPVNSTPVKTVLSLP